MMMLNTRKRAVIATNLRLDRDLHRVLKAEAQLAERSLNAEMAWRLRRSLEQPAEAAA
jgi:predicted HicB family RNase H-like nuclease